MMPTFKPCARLLHEPRFPTTTDYLDAVALGRARQLRRERDAEMIGFTTGYGELMYSNRADYTTVQSVNVETTLLAGLNLQPTFPGVNSFNTFGRGFRVLARGVFNTTGTPTYVFTVRLNPTIGASSLAGTVVGVTAAITTNSGVTAGTLWDLCFDMIVNTPGQGSNNTTLSCSGYIISSGFASQFNAIEPTTPPTATWTATIDNSVNQYLNLSVTPSTAANPNPVTLKMLKVYADL